MKINFFKLPIYEFVDKVKLLWLRKFLLWFPIGSISKVFGLRLEKEIAG
jgi:hypothetical protein